MNTQKDARSALADNMKRLMDNWDMSLDELVKKTELPRVVLDGKIAPNITEIEQIARVFELQAWQLLMPDLPMVDQPEEQ